MYLESELTKTAISERHTLRTVILMEPVTIGRKTEDRMKTLAGLVNTKMNLQGPQNAADGRAIAQAFRPRPHEQHLLLEIHDK
jgi:hypothetical protein